MVKISDAELEVMKVIWKQKATTSIEIIETLQDEADITWNFNTIRTLIKRLQNKGAIEVIKKEGKTYTYKAVIKEDDYKVAIIINLLKKLFDCSISDLVLQYCKAPGVCVEEVEILRKTVDDMIDEKKKQMKSKK